MTQRVDKPSFQNKLAAIVRDDVEQAAMGGKNRGHRWLAKDEQRLLNLDFSKFAATQARNNSTTGWVTVEDVMGVAVPTAMAALDKVNQATGPGKNTVSATEAQAMGEGDPALAQVVLQAYQMARMSPAVQATGIQLAAQLTQYTGTYDSAPSALLFSNLGSEADAPFEAVYIAGPGQSTVDRASFARAIGFQSNDLQRDFARFESPRALMDDLVRSHQQMDRDLLDQQAWYNGPKAAHSQAFRTIILGLKDPKLVVIYPDDGSVAVHPVYVVGTASDGSVVGAKTTTVWT